MKRLSPAEHFRRVGEANEASSREELSHLTLEEASRISAELLALTPLLELPAEEPRQFIALAEMIRRRRAQRERRSPDDSPDHRRDA